jgi:undecaprenyl diphosphate synthase
MNKLNHVAFIMDGNGRWGIKKNQSRNFGHLHGVQTVQKIVRESINLKIPVITFYVFSTENWKRPKSEINYLFRLINLYFLKELKNIIKNNIRINVVGKKTNLPKIIINKLNEVTKKTKNNKKIIVNLAINYGSKSEIIYACKKVLKKKEIVSEKNIQKYLYINSPNPDILIRTGGKKRLSNFLLWQIAYTELYFLDKLWPDFNKKDLVKIINNYKKIKRNYGGI